MNANKLKAIMVLNGDNGGDLAVFLGISRSRFSKKLNRKNAEFTQSEIQAIKDKYNLRAEEVDDIFFTSKVSKKDTIIQ